MYDFDKIIDRRNTGSLKWNVKENEIPLWVADMDFCAAQPVLDAVSRRAAHGVYGYSVVPVEWYEAIASWWKRRHDFTIPSDSLYYATGVVPAISSIVRRVTSPNEKVVLLTPVYNIFFNSVLNNGRRVLESELVFENGEYKINFSDLEQKFSDKETTLVILCNPHNPVGKIWSKEELAEIGRLSEKYSVTVISDEIHCDVVTPGKKYVPYASVSEECAKNSIVCISATKAFNFAGLQCAATYSLNKKLAARINRGLNTDEVAEPNCFAVGATVAAFNECEDWLDEMCAYTSENKRFVSDYLKKNLPGMRAVNSDATYLSWIDCSSFISGGKYNGVSEFAEEIREKTGVYLSEGSQFGKGGENFLRLNAACPRSLIEKALDRIKKYFGE